MNCPNDHEYTPENTVKGRVLGTGGSCKECHNAVARKSWRKAYYAKKETKRSDVEV